MKADTKQLESIRQYLLGQARAEGLSSLEERLLTDSEFYNELLIAEDELIDQYLSGELSESERASFENHFLLTPERQRKVRFGRAFNQYVDTVEPVSDEDPLTEDVSEATRDVPKPPPKPWYSIFLPSQNPILSYSLAAALVLIVVAVCWLALRNWRDPLPRSPGKVFAVTLMPGVTRGEGGDVPLILIPFATDTVQAQLSLAKSDYPNYRAVLLGEARSAVWTSDNLRAQTASGAVAVEFNLPAQLLPPGDYQIKLSGQLSDGSFEDVSSYRFRVRR